MNIEDISRSDTGKLYIGIRTEKLTNISDLELWMKDAVIVSDFALDAVRTKRTQGANRALLKQEIASKILPGVGVTLFEIDIDNKFIKGEQNLHIFNPGNNSLVQPKEIILYLPRNEKKV
jgi:hypothetical protein